MKILVYKLMAGRLYPRDDLVDLARAGSGPALILQLRKLGFGVEGDDPNLNLEDPRPNAWAFGCKDRDGQVALVIFCALQTFVVFTEGLEDHLEAVRRYILPLREMR